jgi:hypothetical protein
LEKPKKPLLPLIVWAFLQRDQVAVELIEVLA